MIEYSDRTSNRETEMSSILRSLAAGVVGGVFIAVVFSAGFFVRDLLPSPSQVSAGGPFPLLQDVISIVETTYLRGSPDETTTQYSAIRGYLSGLGDPATYFVEPPATQVESDALAGVYGGIGVRIHTTTTGEFRLTPFADSPAEEAGIHDGDLLIKIDGTAVEKGTPISAIDVRLRGEVTEGNGVDLEVTRRGNPMSFFVPFDVIIVPSVTYRILDEDEHLGYIQITDFTNRTPAELRDAISSLRKQNALAVIVDLRNNGGGLLQEALTVAGEFIDDGLLLTERQRANEKEYQDTEGGALTDLPLVVLVNDGTASAAEVVAGAIRDYQRGMLIGQQTYGKGTIQQIIQLADKSSVHVTFAEWLTPLGNTIEGVGLTPDIVMIPSSDGADVELAEAIRQLQSSITPSVTTAQDG
ncbi:MAG: S41 family peptidase [Anaerolineae bacterium]|nr:S41 family peptidase [Anaerolineae bacterium]